MKSNQNQIVNIPKLIEAIKMLRVKRLDIMLPANPLERGRVLRELENEIINQLGINDYLTVTAINALIEIIDKPFTDVVYMALIQGLEQLSKLKLQELKVEPRSTWEIKITVRLARLPQDEFKQHIQVLKSMKFRFDDLLKCWYKIYEAGKPVVHPLA